MSGTLSPSATPAREGLENCSEIANVEGGGGWESFFMLSLGGGGGGITGGFGDIFGGGSTSPCLPCLMTFFQHCCQ